MHGREDGRSRLVECLFKQKCAIFIQAPQIMVTDKKHGASASRTVKPVASLNSNDVLLGRGTGSNQYIGNQRFRALVEGLKAEYNSSRRQTLKTNIAKDLLDHVYSLGGRFLQLDEDQKPGDNIVEKGTWYVVGDKIALEKCKQALRQKGMPPAAARESLSRANENTLLPRQNGADVSALRIASSAETFNRSGLTRTLVPLSSDVASPARLSAFPSNVSPFLPSILVGSVDTRLMLFQTDPRVSRPYFQLSQGLVNRGYTSDMTHAQLSNSRIPAAQPDLSFSGNPSASAVSQQQLAQLLASSSIKSQHAVSTDVQGNINVTVDKSGDVEATGQEPSNHNGEAGVASMPREEESLTVTTEDDVSEFLLSILALSGRTKFTEQQCVEEKASLTNEDRAKVLSDLFGKYCGTTHQDKKARRDLDKESIAFLVKQMWVEIEKIPDQKKQALIEAQRVCRAEEFRDTRLEHFLRCVGMDVQVHAVCFPINVRGSIE